jgi:hypothetical protein
MEDPTMSDEALKAIAQIATLLTVLISLTVSMINRSLNKKTAAKLETVHQDVNGKMQQLIEARQAESMAAGETQGRQKAIDEEAARLTVANEVADRLAAKLAAIEEKVAEHDKWERERKDEEAPQKTKGD